MISKGDNKGPYKGTKNLTISRDKNYPIRLTLQYYYVTDTDNITEPFIKQIAEQLEKSYTSGKDKSSLVLGETNRPTEPENIDCTSAQIKYFSNKNGNICCHSLKNYIE
jgi:ubiquitin-protein ligase